MSGFESHNFQNQAEVQQENQLSLDEQALIELGFSQESIATLTDDSKDEDLMILGLDAPAERKKSLDYFNNLQKISPEKFGELINVINDNPNEVKDFLQGETFIITDSIADELIIYIKTNKELNTNQKIKEQEVQSAQQEIESAQKKVETREQKVETREQKVETREQKILTTTQSINSALATIITPLKQSGAASDDVNRLNNTLQIALTELSTNPDIDISKLGELNNSIEYAVTQFLSQEGNLEKVAAEIQKSGDTELMTQFRSLVEGLGDQSLITRLSNFESAPKGEISEKPTLQKARAKADAQIGGIDTKVTEVQNIVVGQEGGKSAHVDVQTGDRWLSVEGCNYKIKTPTEAVGEFYYAESTAGVEYEKAQIEITEINNSYTKNNEDYHTDLQDLDNEYPQTGNTIMDISNSSGTEKYEAFSDLHEQAENAFTPNIMHILQESGNTGIINKAKTLITTIADDLGSPDLYDDVDGTFSKNYSNYITELQDLMQDTGKIIIGFYAKKRSDLLEEKEKLEKKEESYKQALDVSAEKRRDNNEIRDKRVFNMLKFFADIGLDAISQSQLQLIIDNINYRRSSAALSETGLNTDIDFSNGSIGVKDIATDTFDDVEKVAFLKLLNVLATGKADGDGVIFDNPDGFVASKQKLPNYEMRDALMSSGAMNTGGMLNIATVMKNIGGVEVSETNSENSEK